MALYFNYKTPYNKGGKFTKKIEADSILNLFQQIWRLDLNEKNLHEYFIEKFGIDFYGLSHLAYHIVERKVKKPESIEELIKVLKEHSYIGEIKIENEKYLEVETDDDDWELAWYIIDEEYAKKDLKRFDFLIYEGWKLPESFNENKKLTLDFEFKTIINPAEKREGELYFISVCQDEGEGPIDINPTKINGIRLTDLKEYLLNEKFDYETLPKELILYLVKLKEKKETQNDNLIQQIVSFKESILMLHQLCRFHILINSKNLKLGFEESKKEFKQKFDLYLNKSSGFGILDEIHINGYEHFIQISIQAMGWEFPLGDSNIEHLKVYDQIFIFDDLWVNENYHLANSMINYYTNWKL